MKLIQTENRGGSPDGYFDPATGFHYTVDGEIPFWVIVRLPTGAAVRLTQSFVEYDDADAELDRIAALIEGPAPTPAPAQEWVKGPPPKDGQWYTVIDSDGDPTVVRYDFETNDVTPWQTATHFRYANDPTHHLPTPIVLP